MSRVELAINQGSLLQLYSAMWASVYEAILNILGSEGVIIPVGDPQYGKPGDTTFTTVGAEQFVFTWSKAPNAFDVPFDLTDPSSFRGIIPVIDINGVDEVYFERPRKQVVTLRLDRPLIQRLRAIAMKKGIPYSTLIRMWLVERCAKTE